MIPDINSVQATKKNLQLALELQKKLGTHFFEHAMYDVKDGLTSILALCDMEDMKQLAKVKMYIKRVNELLNDVKLYHDSTVFNVNHIIINTINTIKEVYKMKVNFIQNINTIKALAKGNQKNVEQLLLYLLIEAIDDGKEKTTEMAINLFQKEKDAQINIMIKNFRYSDAVLKEIQTLHDPSSFKIQIIPNENDTEVVIKIPLSFDIKCLNEMNYDNSFSLRLGELRLDKKPAEKTNHYRKAEKHDLFVVR